MDVFLSFLKSALLPVVVMGGLLFIYLHYLERGKRKELRERESEETLKQLEKEWSEGLEDEESQSGTFPDLEDFWRAKVIDEEGVFEEEKNEARRDFDGNRE
jgi:hypothetical protein